MNKITQKIVKTASNISNGLIVGVALFSGLAVAGGTIKGIYDVGVRSGIEQMESHQQHQRIVLTPNGYKHYSDVDQDGNFDMVREVRGTDISDTLYVREGFGPSQPIESEVKVVSGSTFLTNTNNIEYLSNPSGGPQYDAVPTKY